MLLFGFWCLYFFWLALISVFTQDAVQYSFFMASLCSFTVQLTYFKVFQTVYPISLWCVTPRPFAPCFHYVELDCVTTVKSILFRSIMDLPQLLSLNAECCFCLYFGKLARERFQVFWHATLHTHTVWKDIYHLTDLIRFTSIFNSELDWVSVSQIQNPTIKWL